MSLTCFADPLQVSGELSLDLLLPPKLQELLPLLHTFSLFGKFSVGTHTGTFFLQRKEKVIHQHEYVYSNKYAFNITKTTHPCDNPREREREREKAVGIAAAVLADLTEMKRKNCEE